MSDAMQPNLAAPPSPPSAAPPSPAPRAVTLVAARRAWHEPRVHFWWIVALGLVAAAAWTAAMQTITWNRDAGLIRNGTRIDAVVWLAGARVKGRPIGIEDIATLEFEFNGQPQVLSGQRVVGRDLPTHSGDTIPLYVDPNDPQRWTARAAPQSLVKMLASAIAMLGLAALLALASVLKRRGVLSIWRQGEAREAAVVESTQSPLAPRSRLVRCGLVEGSDRRLISVYVPRRAGNLQPGDGLWLVMPAGRPDKALAAMLYE